MRDRVLKAGGFSAAYSVIASSVYFTLGGAFVAHEYRLTNLAIGFVQIFLFALIPAAAFGFVLGAVGALALSALPLSNGKADALVAAAVLGAILGSVPPAIARLWRPPDNGMMLPFVPCVVMGSTCAIAWVLLFMRRSRIS